MTTMADEPLFVDTNIIVFASVAEAPLHDVALNAIEACERRGIELWISRQVLREYLATLTRPQTYASLVPVATLVAEIRFFEMRFRVAEDNYLVTERLLALLGNIPIGGRQIHDANIVATMQAYGIGQLLTHNVNDFNRFSRVITVLPLAAIP